MFTRYEKRYCAECWCNHWVEVTETRREICHGKNYLPKESTTHYTRWKAGGIELVEKSKRQISLDWQMAEENQLSLLQEKHEAEYIQDW